MAATDRPAHEPGVDSPHTRPRYAGPYIAAETSMRELTARAVVLGTLLGMIFGASSLYLVLKVGLTVSASIPVAVRPPWVKISQRPSSPSALTRLASMATTMH